MHPVAVKVFQTQDELPAADFWREASILRACRHAHIVRFQGACVDGDTTMLVTELMDTDLYRALQAGRRAWPGRGRGAGAARRVHALGRSAWLAGRRP